MNTPDSPAEPPPADRPTGAFELKFLVTDELAARVLESARTELAPDPHASHDQGGLYRVSSTYFDTATLDVYRRVGRYGKKKFRIRRYGAESPCFLERKAKSRGLVYKRRTSVSQSELTQQWHIADADSWIGDWFRQRTVVRSLVPTTHVAYERTARVGMTPEGPIRLTIDRHIQCQLATELVPPGHCVGPQLLDGLRIVEFKYRVALPTIFKQLIAELALTPARVSKYRLSVEAIGLASTSGSDRTSTNPTPSEDRPVPRSAACG